VKQLPNQRSKVNLSSKAQQITVPDEEPYEDLITTLNECLEKKKEKSNEMSQIEEEEEGFNEEENQRVFARFLRPDGKELYLPGVSQQDSITYRIEALRVYLEHQLGDMVLIAAYQYLQEQGASHKKAEEEVSQDLQKMMGKNIKFLPLMYQLIVCEDNYYCS